MGVFDQLNSGGKSSGGVFSRIQQTRTDERKKKETQIADSINQIRPSGSAPLQYSDFSPLNMKDTALQTLSERPNPVFQPTPEPVREDPSQRNAVTRTLNRVFQDNPVARVINRPFAAAAEAITPDRPMIGRREDGSFGSIPGTSVREEQQRINPLPDTGSEFANKALDVTGQIGSYFMNPGAPAQGPVALYNAARNIGATRGAQAITNRISSPAGQRMAQEAIQEGATAAAYAVPHSLIRGEETAPEIARNVALEGGLGLAGGAAVSALGQGARAAFQKLFQRNSIPEEAAQEILALPAPRERGNPNRAQTPDVIEGRAAPTRARTADKPNPYREKWENLVARAHNMEFTPGRELEELESFWSSIAEPEDPGLDRLIELAYPGRRSVSQGALQRGRSRQVAGLGPNVETNVGAPVVQQTPKSSHPEISQTAGVPLQSMDTPLQSAESPLQSREPRIRDRVYNFLDDQERAARERINARKGRLSSTPVDIYADYAIIGAVKMGKGTIKFADWSEEMVKEFGEQIRPRLNRIYIQSQEQLRRAERLATKEAQEASRFNEGGGDSSSFDKKISWNEPIKKTPINERIQKLRTQLMDDLAPLEDLEKSVRGKLSSAENSLYKTARLFKGVPEKANRYVQDRIVPILQRVESQGHSADDLARYALARHAQDVNEEGFKSGFTNSEIRDVLNKLDSPELESARQELVKVSDDLLQDMSNNGLISDNLLQTLRERWPNYMPLFRSFEDDKVEFASGLSRSLANATAPINVLKGSERKVVNPFESMVKNVFQTVNNVERNKVGQQLARMADVGENPLVRRLGNDEKVGRKNVVSVMENGEKVRYEVPPEVYTAMLNLDQESSNILIDILQKPASLLRAGATLTPEFSLRNPMRDVVQAYITSNSGFNPVLDFPVGLIQAITKGDIYRQWVDNLGAYGNVISMDRKVHREALSKVLKEPPSRQFVNMVTMRPLLNLLRTISDTTEAATKIGEFRAARRSGASPQEAAYRSRDIMDFARAGASIRQANKVIAFLNANIQGKSKLIRAIKENPVGTTTRAITSVTLPTVAAFIAQKYLANEQQKATIDDAPDWQKDTFWMIPIPGTDQVARIPKPFDVAPLFANLPERALDFVYNNDRTAFDNFARNQIGDMALPIQLTGLLPFVEGMANYSFFRQAPIIPQREANREFKDQYDVNTTETARMLAGLVESVTGGEGSFGNFSSPRVMDNTIRGLTAGLGTYATSAVDSILKGLNLSDKPPAPAKDVSQQPLARAFLVNQQGSGKSMDQIYDLRDKLTRERTSARINEKAFNKEDAYEFVNKVTGTIGDISTQIREIQNSREMSPKQKRDQIKALTDQRNKVAREAMRILRDAGIKP